MPRFSIIVPAYGVQGFLRACLESVLSQSYGDFELIAVDDCSPDLSGAIIDEYAARDARVVPVHLTRNGGLGPARNTGMARATGDYLLFLDSDDTFTPGALEAIAARLTEAGDPEVLIFDYARTYWWGSVQRNIMARVFPAVGDEVFTAAEHPEFLDLIMVAWNKAYRRAFVTAHGLTFPPGYYEDTPWTFPVMFSARRIAALDRVCVHYRQRRQGNILRSPGRRHFDVLEQYDRVFAFLDAHPDLTGWRPFLYGKMCEHILDVLARRDRIPAGARAEFFRLAALRYRAHRPPGYRLPGGTTGLKRRLVGHRAYPLFVLLKTLNGRRKAMRSRMRAVRRRIRRLLMEGYYRRQLHRPLDHHLALYSSYWGRGYSCNPAAIHAKARELAPHIRGVFVVERRHAHRIPADVEYVVPGTRAYWRTLARAAYTFNNVNFEHRMVKRAGSVHVQTHHGTPLKFMGVDQVSRPAAARGTRFGFVLQRSDRWDYCLSANSHSTEIWDRAYPCAYRTLPTGYPRNDRYWTATGEDVLRIRRALGIADGVRAVLYAPTHRDYRTDFVPQVDLVALCSALGPGWVVLARAHHLYAGTPQARRLAELGGLIDVTDHPCVEDLCLAADVLVTDYSSIMFDYASLDRPIVIHAEDWEIYRASRGVYFDLLAAPPGPVVRTTEELAEVLGSGTHADEASARLRAAFRARFCEYDDGRAAERVVRTVLLRDDTAIPVRPPADRTPAPSPAQALRAERGAVEPLPSPLVSGARLVRQGTRSAPALTPDFPPPAAGRATAQADAGDAA